jgi:hypothetical protein
MNTLALAALSDHELLLRLREVMEHSRPAAAALLACMAEVDHRQLYARLDLPSMVAYCTEVLRLSEAEAHLRIAAARATREHEELLWLLADGRLSLSGIVKLAPYLSRENRDELLERAAHRTTREIEELVAGLAPAPPVVPYVPNYTDLLGWPDEAEMLEAARDEEEFEAEAELFGKLERLKALMPGEELAVVEAAVAEKLERRARRSAKRVPRRTVAAVIAEGSADRQVLPDPGRDYQPASPGLPAARRLAEWDRAGSRCRFLDAHGRTCPERTGLFPSAYGGLCPVHHRHVPVRDHGRGSALRYWRSRPSST